MNINFFSFPFSTLRHVFLWASIYSFIQQPHATVRPQGEQGDEVLVLRELRRCGGTQTRSKPIPSMTADGDQCDEKEARVIQQWVAPWS